MPLVQSANEFTRAAYAWYMQHRHVAEDFLRESQDEAMQVASYTRTSLGDILLELFAKALMTHTLHSIGPLERDTCLSTALLRPVLNQIQWLELASALAVDVRERKPQWKMTWNDPNGDRHWRNLGEHDVPAWDQAYGLKSSWPLSDVIMVSPTNEWFVVRERK